jgi:beta-carotene 3-hydroxylase
MLLNISIVILTFFAMEGVAWFTHKFIMHGFLWSWHRDHHQKEPGIFEKNDRFFLVFAIPSAISFLIGSLTTYNFLIFIGAGIMLYGIAYFLVHDVFIHRRLKILRNTNFRYFKALRRAHKIHHKHLHKEEGECFGMLLVPWKYFREAK